MKITLVIIAASLFTIGFASGYQRGKLASAMELAPQINEANEKLKDATYRIESKTELLDTSMKILKLCGSKIAKLEDENSILRAQLASNTIPVYSDSADAYIISAGEGEIIIGEPVKP